MAPTTPATLARRIIALRRQLVSRRPDVAVGFMHSSFVPLALACLGTRVPVIGSEHTVYGYYRTRTVDRWLIAISTRWIAAMTAVSISMRATFPPSVRRLMRIIPNPVSQATTRADTAGAADRRTILNVGRLAPEKDQRTLVAAFATLADDFPEWRLRIVGEGPLRLDLERQIAHLGLIDRIDLAGASAQVDQEYDAAQIFATSSKLESFGLVTAEAMAHGLPTIGFADCPGTNELITDGENGRLVWGADRAAALSAGLRELMASPELRARYGAAGTAGLAALSVDHSADQWEMLLRDVTRR